MKGKKQIEAEVTNEFVAAEVTDGDVPASLGTDAEKWAKEFGERIVKAGEDRGGWDTPDQIEAFALGWFANAIEAGRTAGQSSYLTYKLGDIVADDATYKFTGAELHSFWGDAQNAHIESMPELPSFEWPMKVSDGTFYKVSGEAAFKLIVDAMAKGRDEHLRAGLNDTGDVPMLTLTGNAVEFVVVTDDGKEIVSVNVDGRTRMIVDDVGRIVVIDNNNRYVVLSDDARQHMQRIDDVSQFAGYLTTRPDVIKVGASEPVYPVLEAVKAFKALPASTLFGPLTNDAKPTLTDNPDPATA